MRNGSATVTLKDLAEHLGLAPATISLVLNQSPVAKTITAETQARILEAARKFNYRPNFRAKCLRKRRSFTVGVMVSEVSEGYNAPVISGMEDALVKEGYFYFVVSHRFRPDLIDEYVELFLDRSVDGLIVVNTPWQRSLSVPVVTVSCHHSVRGTTSIVLDHRKAVEIALRHLLDLGHRRIAFIKGPGFIPDAEVRWNAILDAAASLKLQINPKLIAHIEGEYPILDWGYEATRKLIAGQEPFSALFAFNDPCAMQAIRAMREARLRVPEEVSVVGFDDIDLARYQNPGLTTVRQPLRKMGELAAETMLARILGEKLKSDKILVEPELVIRDTTCLIHPGLEGEDEGALNSLNRQCCQV